MLMTLRGAQICLGLANWPLLCFELVIWLLFSLGPVFVCSESMIKIISDFRIFGQFLFVFGEFFYYYCEYPTFNSFLLDVVCLDDF